MKALLSLLLISCFGSSSAQRLFHSSQDINKSDYGRPIKAIHPHWGLGSLASSLTVLYKDGGKQKINRDSIWGFEDASHLIFRSYKGGFYRVDSLASLIQYTDVTGRGNFRYFSKGLDSPLYGTKRAARADPILVQP